MNKIFFLIGSSGSGKTTASESIEGMKIPNLTLCFPDRQHIPSLEEMVKEYGSTDEWQKMHNFAIIEEVKNKFINKGNVLVDTQSRPSFIEEGCRKYGINSYKIILFDCSDQVRKERLVKRGHPELANDRMMDWARYLRQACTGENCTIVDTTELTKEQCKDILVGILSEQR